MLSTQIKTKYCLFPPLSKGLNFKYLFKYCKCRSPGSQIHSSFLLQSTYLSKITLNLLKYIITNYASYYECDYKLSRRRRKSTKVSSCKWESKSEQDTFEICFDILVGNRIENEKSRFLCKDEIQRRYNALKL